MRFHMQHSLGLPDPGNLRTNKKRDVRSRIKAIGALMKQRQRDIEFRQQFESKMSRLQMDKEMLQEKLGHA